MFTDPTCWDGVKMVLKALKSLCSSRDGVYWVKVKDTDRSDSLSYWIDWYQFWPNSVASGQWTVPGTFKDTSCVGVKKSQSSRGQEFSSFFHHFCACWWKDPDAHINYGSGSGPKSYGSGSGPKSYGSGPKSYGSGSGFVTLVYHSDAVQKCIEDDVFNLHFVPVQYVESFLSNHMARSGIIFASVLSHFLIYLIL